MKKKIVGTFVCMLLIATVLPATGTRNDTTIPTTGTIDSIPVLDFVEIKGGLLGISVVLTNFGEGTAENINWEMNASGGLFFYPKMRSGTIEILNPDQYVKIKIWPVIGLGKTTITFYCSYNILNFSYDMTVELKQEWREKAFVFWHSFPETIQPAKEWVVIENFSYFNRTNAMGVEFNVEGINNMHNVRVVIGLPSRSQEIEFLGACKFIEGIGTLFEYGITEDLVMSGDAHWELELVDGE
jgi:hypothetical protein